ncbi:MAG: hypothetical protein M0T74_08395, partial [Desulfitobacterium hafniense]|nr:hypothetical protein [Desulfitobacterium hafniense]
MLEFTMLVIVANLSILACLYVIRHTIAIKTPVLLIAVGISVFFCVLFPVLAVRVPYPMIIYL